jgi:hypothetical protein
MTSAVANDVALTAVEADLVEHIQVLATRGGALASLSLEVKKWRKNAFASSLDLTATVQGSQDRGNWTPIGQPLTMSYPTIGTAPRSGLVLEGWQYLRVRYDLVADTYEQSSSVLFSAVLRVEPGF